MPPIKAEFGVTIHKGQDGLPFIYGNTIPWYLINEFGSNVDTVAEGIFRSTIPGNYAVVRGAKNGFGGWTIKPFEDEKDYVWYIINR